MTKSYFSSFFHFNCKGVPGCLLDWHQRRRQQCICDPFPIKMGKGKNKSKPSSKGSSPQEDPRALTEKAFDPAFTPSKAASLQAITNFLAGALLSPSQNFLSTSFQDISHHLLPRPFLSPSQNSGPLSGPPLATFSHDLLSEPSLASRNLFSRPLSGIGRN